ncbi:MAG: cytochrome c peroxidase [Desulfosarcinaceae bacterium]|nr:cytochrome c peroxidase [Desulfosarcinaceae bacterium]
MKKKNLILLFVAVFFLTAGPALAKGQFLVKKQKKQLVNLGKAIFNDVNLSFNQNQSCKTCHHPSAGFADPENRVAPTVLPVSDGSIPELFGGRNAPTAAYAGFSPIFHYDAGEGLFVGGLFWDGRATGRMDVTATGDLGAGPTGDPLADQAKGPFGNPVEMALTFENTGFTTEEEVVAIIQASNYARKFEKVFGPGAFDDIAVAYNNASIAIAAFERSKRVNRFKSKFDKFIREQGGDVSDFGVEVQPDGFRKYVGPPARFKSKAFSYDEADGLAIFNSDSYTQMGMTPDGQNGGMCYLCHLTTNHEVVDDDNRPINGPAPGIYHPILTDFTYDNLGIPVNPRIAVLAGPQDTDLGLGGQPTQLDAAYGEAYPFVADEEGKFKVSSLRNLSRTAPYGHNGFFATIYDIVHFYNTRDVDPTWPGPEVPATVNGDELGNLGLTLAQEQKLVLFLETLTD